MLFDLRGKRKRLIQVVYAFLALLIAFGLIFLGIGSGTSGGLLDSLGLGSNSANSDPQYQQEVDDANSKLESNPKDTQALLTVARYEYLIGQQQMDVNDQGVPVINQDAAASFGKATDAWERYVAALPKGEQPNPAVAGLIAQAYANVAGTQQDVTEFTRTHGRAGDAATVVAIKSPNPTSWLRVAAYYYYSGQPDKGKQAGEKAIKSADKADRNAVQQQLDQFEKASGQIEKALKSSSKSSQSSLQNPLAPLGGSTGLGATIPAPGG